MKPKLEICGKCKDYKHGRCMLNIMFVSPTYNQSTIITSNVVLKLPDDYIFLPGVQGFDTPKPFQVPDKCPYLLEHTIN